MKDSTAGQVACVLDVPGFEMMFSFSSFSYLTEGQQHSLLGDT